MDLKDIKPLVDDGKSIREIALVLNCSYTNVRYWLKKFNLQTKNKYEKIYKETNPYFKNKTYKFVSKNISPEKIIKNSQTKAAPVRKIYKRLNDSTYRLFNLLVACEIMIYHIFAASH